MRVRTTDYVTQGTEPLSTCRSSTRCELHRYDASPRGLFTAHMLLSAQRTRPRPRPSSATDRVLVQRLTRGDEAAFSELFARYRSTVYATAYAVLLDPEQVAAVVTDAFEEARRSAAAFLDTRGTVSGWLTHLTRLRIAARHYTA